MYRFSGVLGILVLLSLAYVFSTNRRAIRLKTVLWGLGLQFLFAVLVIRFPLGIKAMAVAGAAVTHFLGYSLDGAKFVFGNLALPSGSTGSMGFFFAFQVLPTIIFISAFFALMYYLGIMQLIIRGFAWVMTRVMGVSGAESLNVAASIFMGQTEAPLTIRPFLPECTQSELMTIMTAGMAHVSGGIMAAYILYGIKAEHLLSAVIMTAPGTILMSKLLVPETEKPKTAGHVEMPHDEATKNENLLGSIARGTIDGGKLAFNVAIMLISFIALVAAADGAMGWVHGHLNWFPESLATVGNLLGSRMVINELYAYTLLGNQAQQHLLDPRSVMISTFALCGFANLSSIGIQIGGISALAPERRNDLARLGFRAMLAGTMANLVSAAIVGLLVA